jgi:VanZ family protein
MRKICRILAWVVLVAVLLMTISPIQDRPALPVGPSLERAGAFFLLGLLFSIGYRSRWLLVVALVVGVASVFEAAQLLTSDRHAEIQDAAVKIVGGLMGVACGYVIAAVRPHW